MPLTATFDSGHNHFPSENVYFFMNDGNQRIRCGVSELALEVFDPKFQRTKQGRLQAFNMFRKEIEGVASGKYDRGELEADGRTVLVTAIDIKNWSPLRPRQSSNQDRTSSNNMILPINTTGAGQDGAQSTLSARV